MSYVRVKVCGITREDDARAAIRHGADAVGFVLWPDSPRALPLVTNRCDVSGACAGCSRCRSPKWFR